MSTFTNTAREVEMPNGDVVVIHNAPTGGENTTSNIKKFKYDDNGHVTESTAADAEDLNLSGYSTPTTGSTDIGTSDDVQTAIGKLDHQSHIDQTNILSVQNATEELVDKGAKNIIDIQTPEESLLTSYTSTANGGVALTIKNAAWTSYRVRFSTIINTAYVCKILVDSAPTTNVNVFIQNSSGENYTGGVINSNTTEFIREFTATETALGRLSINLNNEGTPLTNAITVRVMICTKAEYDSSPNYEAYALPNYDLTRLEAEDRASLAEVVDSGAKNLSPLNTAETSTSAGQAVFNVDNLNLASGTYVFSFTENASSVPSSGNIVQFSITYTDSTTENMPYITTAAKTRSVVTYTFAKAIKQIKIYAGYVGCSLINIMICTKAAFGVSQKFVPFGNDPFYQVPINHNMIYRGQNLGATLTDAQHTALSSGNFTDLYLGDYWTKTVTIPAGTYTGGDGQEVTVPAQTNITLKAVIADFDTFYAGYASTYAGINTHHAAVIVTGFSNVVWNKTNSTAGGYVASLIHKWLVGSALPQIETWFGSAKVLSHQKLLTNAITGDAASGWAWSSQKIALLSENQMYGSKVWGNSKASNGGYEPGEAFKHLNVFNHIDANLLFGNKNIWLRDIASAEVAASLSGNGGASGGDASNTWIAPAALILLS